MFNLLPNFLARWTLYLAEVAGTVVKAVAARGKPELPLEVTGPDPRTALRWFRELRHEQLPLEAAWRYRLIAPFINE